MVSFQPLLKQNDYAGSSASALDVRTETAELQHGHTVQRKCLTRSCSALDGEVLEGRQELGRTTCSFLVSLCQ